MALSGSYKSELLVSARKQLGIETLKMEIESILDKSMYRIRLLVPYEEGQIVSQLFEQAHVETQEHLLEGIYLCVQVPASLYGKVAQFQIME